MPSPPFPRRLPHPEVRRRPGRRIAAAAVLGVLMAAALACTSAPPPPPVRQPVPQAPEPLALDAADRPYVLDPMEGYTREADAQLRDRLERVWHDLVDTGDTAEAIRASAEMLDASPGFLPAQVLAAQVDFAAGENTHVVTRLLPVGDTLPTYTASQMLIGRAAERLGDVALAYSAYRAVAARSSLALKRAGELHPRAMEIVSHRLDESLKAQEVDEAQKQLAMLLYWLVPQVRNSLPTAGRIATDVLDNSHREEIVRVVNLGLMDVDSTQHRFYPGSSVRRGQALRTVVRTLARFGAAACANQNPEGGDICDVSLACGLVGSGEDC